MLLRDLVLFVAFPSVHCYAFSFTHLLRRRFGFHQHRRNDKKRTTIDRIEENLLSTRHSFRISFLALVPNTAISVHASLIDPKAEGPFGSIARESVQREVC